MIALAKNRHYSMNTIKHITVAAVLALFSGCSAGIVPGPAAGVQLSPRLEGPVAGAEEGFQLALEAERRGDADASYRLSRQVAEQFPNTVWYQRALFLMERALIRLDRTNEAEAMMLRIQQEYPELADYAVLLLADHHAARSRFTSAGALYQHLAERWPGTFLAPRSRYQQGRMLFEAQAYRQAAEAFEGFLREDRIPDFAPDAALGLARSLTGAMDLGAAVRAYHEVYVAYPGDPRDDEVMTALTLFRESGIETSAFTAEQLSSRGKNLFRTRQYEKAAAAFSAALETDPQHPRQAELSLKRGISLFHLGRRAEAMQVLERSMKENEKEGRGPEALNWLGKTYSRLGEREKAVKTYLRIVTDYTESEWADDALYLIGNIYRDANDRANTLKFYGRLAEEFPGSPFADSAIWWKAWSQYTAGEYRSAEQTLRMLVSRYPRSFLVNQAVYWQGRACERRADPQAAASHYQRLLKRSPYTYYGYLAAERLSRIEADVLLPEGQASAAAGTDDTAIDTGPPDWTDDEGPPVWTGEAVQLLSAEPAFRKALELMHLEMKQEAAAELWGLQERLRNKRRTVLGMSKTFFELGDYYRSFILVARNYEKLLEGPAVETPRDLWLLAYPQGYWDSIVVHARAYGQDPYFIASIIRQESHFQADAVSPAGARGLMQVMPSTGEWAARMIRLDGSVNGNLYDADRNIRLGTWYVSQLMKRYRNDPFLVAAAYNAGPAVASSWLEKYGGTTVEKDELAELIPYTETRWYVKRVLTNYAEYRRLYGRSGKPVRFLSARADASEMWQDEEVEVP